MPINIPQHMQGKVQHALDSALQQEKLFPAAGHQGYEPEGINSPWFRDLYDRPTPIPGVNLGDVIPPMAAAEGFTRAGEAFGRGDTGTGIMDTGFAMLDALDPSPMAWGALGSGIGMTAWHGSPHKWDKVDLGKVGTGEGAQAYGHGFYSAENQAIGTQYQNELSKLPRIHGKPVNETMGGVQSYVYRSGGDVDSAISNISDDIAGLGDSKIDAIRRKGAEGIHEKLLTLKVENAVTKPGGHLYELDISDDVIDKMLDWDAPLSEQSPHVLDAIMSGNPNFAGVKDKDWFTGEKIYDALGGKLKVKNSFERQAKQSEILESLGIPGIKYWDGSSRTAGEGTRNYVNFNADDIKAISRNGVPIHELDELISGKVK